MIGGDGMWVFQTLRGTMCGIVRLVHLGLMRWDMKKFKKLIFSSSGHAFILCVALWSGSYNIAVNSRQPE